MRKAWFMFVSSIAVVVGGALWVWETVRSTTVSVVGCSPEARECLLPLNADTETLLLRFSQKGTRPSDSWELLRTKRVQARIRSLTGAKIAPSEATVELSPAVPVSAGTGNEATYAKYGKLTVHVLSEHSREPIEIKFFKPDGKLLGRVVVVLEKKE